MQYPYYASLPELAHAVDTLIVVLPGGAATQHAINTDILSALGREGILINVARGSVVDEPALIAALQSETILAAGLDVFAQEPKIAEALRALENVVLTPHIAAATHQTRRRVGELVIRNVISWFDGTGAVTPVPDTSPPMPCSRGKSR